MTENGKLVCDVGQLLNSGALLGCKHAGIWLLRRRPPYIRGDATQFDACDEHAKRLLQDHHADFVAVRTEESGPDE